MRLRPMVFFIKWSHVYCDYNDKGTGLFIKSKIQKRGGKPENNNKINKEWGDIKQTISKIEIL